jgi:tetratricopeptide (TPR) repeat protein
MPQQKYLTELRRILAMRFDDGELRTLCFGLGIDYADLPGKGKENKARELVACLGRRERISELVEMGKKLRPDVLWDDALRLTKEAARERSRYLYTLHVSMARVYYAADQVDKGLKAVEQAIGLDPSNHEANDLPLVVLSAKGEMREQDGDWKRAKDAFDLAISQARQLKSSPSRAQEGLRRVRLKQQHRPPARLDKREYTPSVSGKAACQEPSGARWARI